jgi:hypothetical protein
MSFRALETAKMPPFFGKNEWNLDITKIITKPPTIVLPTIPEEEDEMENPQPEVIDEIPDETPVIKVKTSVHFAPYVLCHKRIGNANYTYKMEPSYNTRGRLHRIEMLEDEVFILKRKEEKLMKTIDRKNKRIDQLEAINHILICTPLIVLFIAYVFICKYFLAK